MCYIKLAGSLTTVLRAVKAKFKGCYQPSPFVAIKLDDCATSRPKGSKVTFHHKNKIVTRINLIKCAKIMPRTLCLHRNVYNRLIYRRRVLTLQAIIETRNHSPLCSHLRAEHIASRADMRQCSSIDCIKLIN